MLKIKHDINQQNFKIVEIYILNNRYCKTSRLYKTFDTSLHYWLVLLHYQLEVYYIIGEMVYYKIG